MARSLLFLKNMKHTLILLFSIFLLGCGNSQKITHEYLNQDIPPVYKMNLKFKYIPAYCGGAAPSNEMEAERQKGLAWRSQVLYMDKNGANNFESFVTDQYGYLKLALLEGNYCIKKPYKIEEAKLMKFKNEGWEFSQECLKQELEKCDFSFQISKDTTIEYVVYGRCQYDGPIPCVSNPGPPPP